MADRTGRRSPVPGEQRVFSLVLALVASPQGATKRDLLSSVYGYADRYSPGVQDIALERQFERDKNSLRELGVRIETIDSPEESGNNQLIRYRIAKDVLQVPDTLHFSEAELSLLRGAALAWSEGSLTAESRRAVMKLAALGAGIDTQYLGVAPQLGIPEAAASHLQRAIETKQVVAFEYWNPERAAPYARRVAPLRLHRADGRWHLVAYDLERNAYRVFLISRIAGQVKLHSEHYAPELISGANKTIIELQNRIHKLIAIIDVREGTIGEARLLPRAEHVPDGTRGFRRLRLGTLDFHELARELCSFGADVQVVEPAELRDQVIDMLSLIAQSHREVGVIDHGTHA